MKNNWRMENRMILIRSRNSTEAVSNLYAHFKTHDKKFSFGLICLKTGIKSKGHVSDLMSGRRYINSKHRHSFARLFKLEEIEEAYFKLLILIDSATTAKERTELTERSHVVRKALSAETRVVSLEDETDLYSTLEIFAAFGLFENKPTLMQLVKLYEKRNDVSVPKALNRLEEMNMIYTTGEGQFGIRHDQVFFNSSSKGSHISYLQTAIMEAHSKVPELFLEKDDAYFDAKVISVQRDEYKRILREIRLAINETQSKMESGNADTLVRFSVQVFPISFEL